MDVKVKQLLMVSVALGQNIEDLWEVYSELFGEIDLDNHENCDIMLELVNEFEHNMIDLMDQVNGQIYLMTGMYEPVPKDKVDDFESSVLRSIAELGNVDLDSYRVELE